MKKSFINILFLFIFTIIFTSTASADVIPPNSHSLNRCVSVVNLDEFPNVTLIGYYTGPMVDNYETYKIENNKCLTKGYKFNTLSIYWNTKDKQNTIDSDKILLKDIEPYGGYIDENNPLVKEDIEYSIAGFNGGKLVLYKSKQGSEYNDDTPTKVETFAKPLQNTQPKNQDQQQKEVKPTPTPNIDKTNDQSNTTPLPEPFHEPAKKGFWQSIVCFFRSLFGKGC